MYLIQSCSCLCPIHWRQQRRSDQQFLLPNKVRLLLEVWRYISEAVDQKIRPEFVMALCIFTGAILVQHDWYVVFYTTGQECCINHIFDQSTLHSIQNHDSDVITTRPIHPESYSLEPPWTVNARHDYSPIVATWAQ